MTNVFVQLPVTSRTTQRGFTLTELAIVLGIMGVILGAIWTAASMVYANMKVKNAQTQAIEIVNNFRELWTGQQSPNLGDWTDITCVGVGSGYFPSDMLPPSTCTTGTFSTYPQGPWAGSYVAVQSYQSLAPGIIIGYNHIPQSACNTLSLSLSTTSSLEWENINGNTQWVNGVNGGGTPANATTISGLCVPGNTNNIYFMFTPQ